MSELIEDTKCLADGFIASAARSPERPALSVAGKTYSYARLRAAALDVAARIDACAADGTATAVFVPRGFSAYAGVLGAVLRGNTYVPVNPGFPDERNREIIRRSGVQTMVCGSNHVDAVNAILEPLRADGSGPQLVVVDENPEPSDIAEPPTVEPPIRRPRPTDNAYIMFTSGSTGSPKGVPINHANITAYLEAIDQVLSVTPDDRFSQTFELTFDISVHDIWVCWKNAAHLIVPSKQDLLDPVPYFRDNEITFAGMVPTLCRQMRQAGSLAENTFPAMRSTIFGGEALPADLTRDWMRAAPNAVVENWYGTTETTIYSTGFRCTPEWLAQADMSGNVPIGKALPATVCLVCDENLNPLGGEEPGELLLGGPQVAAGYLNDPERTAERFITLPSDGERYYRTGDLVRRDGDGNLIYLDRIDNQVKIRGYRTELGEIEAALRKVSPGHSFVAVPYPVGSKSPDSVVAAVEGEVEDAAGVIAALRDTLPNYMLPKAILGIGAFPTNASGKADRNAIAKLIDEQLTATEAAAEARGRSNDVQDLLAILDRIVPGLDHGRLMEVETLFDSGIDSLAFVNFVMALEQRYGLDLDQQDVSSLSRLSLPEIAEAVTGRRSFEELPPGRQARALRAHQFLHEFPDFIKNADKPLALVVGSSGVYRGLDTKIFDETAKTLGHEVCSVNVGLPALSMEGQTQICEFIRDCCQRAGKILEVVAYEFDPMMASIRPPGGDLEILADHEAGRHRLRRLDGLAEDFAWRPERSGTVVFREEPEQAEMKANWERKRDIEIVETYRGRLPLDDTPLQTWIRGAHALAVVSKAMYGFVQPLNEDRFARRLPWNRPNALRSTLEALEREVGFPVHDRFRFRLDKGDFLTINHVNPWRGMRNYSSQLARLTFAYAARTGAGGADAKRSDSA